VGRDHPFSKSGEPADFVGWNEGEEEEEEEKRRKRITWIGPSVPAALCLLYLGLQFNRWAPSTNFIILFLNSEKR
jgi:hypothetical protein